MKEDDTFLIPDKLIEKIFEISGGTDNRNKGLILAVCNDIGDPVIYSKFNESIVQLGLFTALGNYLKGFELQNQQPENLQNQFPDDL